MASKIVLNICKIDDPLDAFAVHGACGIWGCLATGLFGVKWLDGFDGAFYGNERPFYTAIIFCLANFAWTGGMSVIMFLPLKMAGLLRVSADIEDAGMDVSKHGGSAYPTSEGT